MKPDKITITEQPDGTFKVVVRRYELTKIGSEPTMYFAWRLALDLWNQLLHEADDETL